ncbi:MAG TPA: outer membrane beta-barrel protein [Terriglobales bacterium]|nr:outer membrane beta-barrel protein [Terriglobales bacterium]
MNKSFAVLLTLALFAATRPISAQEPISKFEAYGGYYYVRFNVNGSAAGGSPSETFNGNGGGVQIEFNANRWLGVVGDLAGYGATATTNGALVGGAVTYLFGPRVNFRRDRFTPFAQVLFGGIWTTAGIANSSSENSFAMTAGGGIDFKESSHISIRPVQAEYLLTKIPDNLNDRQNNLRIGAGIVVRLSK